MISPEDWDSLKLGDIVYFGGGGLLELDANGRPARAVVDRKNRESLHLTSQGDPKMTCSITRNGAFGFGWYMTEEAAWAAYCDEVLAK